MTSGDPDRNGPEPAQPPSGEAAGTADSPYRNLWVPLVVVPAIVVGVIVMVFALFGQIAGSEKGIEENLDRMLRGGANEREQAAFGLVQQILANREAEAAGQPVEWGVGPDFDQRLEAAWDAFEEEGNQPLALVVATLMADRGDPGAIDHVVRFLDLDESQDPGGELRFMALQTLALHGGPEVAERVIAMLHDPDHGLRLAAATALQRMPSEASREALRELLDDESLELRGTAAVSLSHLGDASGADLLRDLCGTDVYEAARAANPKKFARGEDVRRSRIQAVRALGRLGRSEDRAFLEGLAQDESDGEVREAAMQALAGAAGGD